ncbi:MAG: hypothetical protein HY553_17030 [Elusimicrobia bacterium]|nr:hypothetical protein [Elusimicrobiota bacterium]
MRTVLALLLAAAAVQARERGVKTPAPPDEERAAKSKGLDLSTELGEEMSGEFEKAQSRNLETAAAAADDELSKTCLFADRLLQEATAQSPGARGLAMKVHRWTAKRHDFGLLDDPTRDRLRRLAYRPANRASDLRKAQQEAAAAASRYGLRGLPSRSEALARSLDDVVGELDALGSSTLYDQLKREASLLRAQLMLRAADRKMTGRTLE